jgi:hypothetical protein
MKRLSMSIPMLAVTTLLAGPWGCASPDCSDTATCGSAIDGSSADSSGSGDAPSDLPTGSDGGSVPCNASAPDCSNPQCLTGFRCTATAPAGWFGPVALYDQGGGPPAPKPLACSGAYPRDAFDGWATPSNAPLTCACTCGVAKGPCSNANIAVYNDGQCANPCATAGADGCTTANGPTCKTGGASARFLAAPKATGTWTCGSSATTTGTPPAWDWTQVGRGCGAARTLTTDGCAATAVCADNPPPGEPLCVFQAADVADCTGAPGYPNIRKYYTTASDQRYCGSGNCGCANSTNTTCSVLSANWYNAANASCGSGGNLLDTSGSCNMNLGSQVISIDTTIVVSGSCGPTGTPTSDGSITPNSSSAITACCTN